jgi:vacuolar-type H+-ATPase subunit F/Vma7
MTEVVGGVAVLGERLRVQAFALAGALVSIAEDEDAARRAWRALPGDVVVVILTPKSAAALAGMLPDARRLTVVMS